MSVLLTEQEQEFLQIFDRLEAQVTEQYHMVQELLQLTQETIAQAQLAIMDGATQPTPNVLVPQTSDILVLVLFFLVWIIPLFWPRNGLPVLPVLSSFSCLSSLPSFSSLALLVHKKKE